MIIELSWTCNLFVFHEFIAIVCLLINGQQLYYYNFLTNFSWYFTLVYTKVISVKYTF